MANAPLKWPRSNEPWGLTSYMADTEATIVNTPEPVMVVGGTGRKKIVIRTPRGPILSLCHVFDSDGNELMVDVDRDIRYTVLLNKKMPLPADTRNEDESSLIPFVEKKEGDRETIFYINNLPKPGLYKVQIFARKKPRKRGKLILPLVATLLLDYKAPGKAKKPENKAEKKKSAGIYAC